MFLVLVQRYDFFDQVHERRPRDRESRIAINTVRCGVCFALRLSSFSRGYHVLVESDQRDAREHE